MLLKIKSLRKELGLTQDALGLELGISKQALSGYELGRRTPDVAMLIKMADFFGVTVDELLDHRSPPDSVGCCKCRDFAHRDDIIEVARILTEVPRVSTKHLYLMLEAMVEPDSIDNTEEQD